MRLVSSDLEQFVARHFGQRGREWLDRLPHRVEYYRQEWQLEIEHVVSGGLMSSCLAVRTASGTPAVLKLSGPWTPAAPEALALRRWNAGPAPALIRVDEDGTTLLLEMIVPGNHFKGSARAEDVARVGQLLAALHAPALSNDDRRRLPTLAEVVREQIATAGAEATARSLAEAAELRPRLELARRRADDLLGSLEGPDVLLHGDLENKNILHCRTRDLVAIDPLPCSGDPSYDAGYWLASAVHPVRRDEAGALLARQLGLEPHRVRLWASVVGLEG